MHDTMDTQVTIQQWWTQFCTTEWKHLLLKLSSAESGPWSIKVRPVSSDCLWISRVSHRGLSHHWRPDLLTEDARDWKLWSSAHQRRGSSTEQKPISTVVEAAQGKWAPKEKGRSTNYFSALPQFQWNRDSNQKEKSCSQWPAAILVAPCAPFRGQVVSKRLDIKNSNQLNKKWIYFFHPHQSFYARFHIALFLC